jgi:hypothetical protein
MPRLADNVPATLKRIQALAGGRTRVHVPGAFEVIELTPPSR